MCYILNATAVAQEQDWIILLVAAKELGPASTPPLQQNNNHSPHYLKSPQRGPAARGARVINCHNFFFTPDRETRRIDHTTTEGTAERKMRQFATPAPFTPAPFRPF